jgi:rod shape-determining protein MreC
MQYYIQLIIKNSYLLLFLLLLIIGVYLTINSHSYHKSKIVSSANSITGNIHQTTYNIESYFNLKTENESLLNENKRLKNLLFNKKDSLTNAKYFVKNSKSIYDVLTAKVILNKYNSYNNFITINAGSKVGIKKEMGVINGKGIIGFVEKTSTNYATVMSVLNVKSKINAKIKNTNSFGELNWNGKSTGFIQLIDLPRLASIKIGDTIVTGNTIYFPDDINVGVVHKIYTNEETNYFTLDIKLFNDMTSLGSVFILKNKHKNEIENLINQTEKQE